MSNFFLADRIKELSRVESTNDIVLDGAVNGFSSFGDFFASGDVVFYAITDNVKYEIGSGVYQQSGSDRTITRTPFRSSNIDIGPYYLNGTSNGGPTDGQSGYFYPMWLSRSAAQSGVGYTDGPYTSVMEHTFDETPGVTFYMPSEHQGHGTAFHGGVSGDSYNTAQGPVSFDPGVKEVYVTYPAKTSVYTGYGLESDTKEPKASGLAFWRNGQMLNYTAELTWDDDNNFLGIDEASPESALHVGGIPSYSSVRVSGIIEGGSGILFSGGNLTYTGKTASGGKQLEPFLRNQLGNAADGVIQVSGLVDQFIGFAQQSPGTFFSGPESGYCGTPPCTPDYPTFRLIDIGDLPTSEISSALQTSYSFLTSGDPISFLTNDSSYMTASGFDATGFSNNLSTSDDTIQEVFDKVDSLEFGGSGFKLTNGNVAADTIAYTDTVTISGVSGVDVDYISSNNFMRVSAGSLSGALQGQITDNIYQFYTVASGVGANNNSLKAMASDSVIAISGVSGVKIDFVNQTDGTNSSGIFVIGKSAGSYSFNITNGKVAADTITDTETITVSGVSGVNVEYDSANNFMRIGTTSSSYGATSGVKLENSNFIMDPTGVGNLANLNLVNETAGSIPLSVEMASGQTANVFEINYSGGTGGDAFRVEDDGTCFINDTGQVPVLNLPHEYTKTQNFNATTLTDAANISWDLESNQVASVVLGGNRTLDNPTSMKDGGMYALTIKQDATGSRVLTFSSAYKFPGGTAPTLTTSISGIDIVTFISDGTNMFGVSQLDFS